MAGLCSLKYEVLIISLSYTVMTLQPTEAYREGRRPTRRARDTHWSEPWRLGRMVTVDKATSGSLWCLCLLCALMVPFFSASQMTAFWRPFPAPRHAPGRAFHRNSPNRCSEWLQVRDAGSAKGWLHESCISASSQALPRRKQGGQCLG